MSFMCSFSANDNTTTVPRKCLLTLSCEKWQQDVPYNYRCETADFQKNKKRNTDNQETETYFVVFPWEALEFQWEHRYFRYQQPRKQANQC